MLNRFMTIRVSLNFFKEYKERHLGYVLLTQRIMALKKEMQTGQKKNIQIRLQWKCGQKKKKKKKMNEKKGQIPRNKTMPFLNNWDNLFSSSWRSMQIKNDKKGSSLSWGKLETVNLPMDFLNIINVFIY